MHNSDWTGSVKRFMPWYLSDDCKLPDLLSMSLLAPFCCKAPFHSLLTAKISLYFFLYVFPIGFVLILTLWVSFMPLPIFSVLFLISSWFKSVTSGSVSLSSSAFLLRLLSSSLLYPLSHIKLLLHFQGVYKNKKLQDLQGQIHQATFELIV